MFTRKKLSEERGLPLLVALAVGVPLMALFVTFREARIALMNLGGKPREATIQELREGKIRSYTWVATKGALLTGKYIRETHTRTNTKTGVTTSFAEDHHLLVSPDDPQMKTWAEAAKTLQETAEILNTKDKSPAEPLPSVAEAYSDMEKAPAILLKTAEADAKRIEAAGAKIKRITPLMPRLKAADKIAADFNPTHCVGVVSEAPPDSDRAMPNFAGEDWSQLNKSTEANLNAAIGTSDFTEVSAQRELVEKKIGELQSEISETLGTVQNDTPITGILEPAPANIQQKFSSMGATPPAFEIVPGAPDRNALYEFVGAGLFLLAEGMGAAFLYRHWKSNR